MTKKPKATKNLNKGGEALNEVVKETKKQVELIERQIADIKAMKG
jgi:chaperonin cofactor prefoldin